MNEGPHVRDCSGHRTRPKAYRAQRSEHPAQEVALALALPQRLQQPPQGVGGAGSAPSHRATSEVMSSLACSPKEMSSLVLSASPVEKSVMVASGSACPVTGSVTCSAPNPRAGVSRAQS